MLISGSKITESIKQGVPSRFGKENKQINLDGAVSKTEGDDPTYYFPLIENTIDPLIIEGAVYDLRLGEVFVHSSEKAKLFNNKRNTGMDFSATKRILDGKDCFLFEKNKYYLCKTIESVNLPVNFQGLLFPRTTMFRSGIQILHGTVQPNYYGSLTFGLKNISDADIFIEQGFRCLSIGFEYIEGESIAYNGNWQDGRDTGTNGEFDPAR